MTVYTGWWSEFSSSTADVVAELETKSPASGETYDVNPYQLDADPDPGSASWKKWIK